MPFNLREEARVEILLHGLTVEALAKARGRVGKKLARAREIESAARVREVYKS